MFLLNGNDVEAKEAPMCYWMLGWATMCDLIKVSQGCDQTGISMIIQKKWVAAQEENDQDNLGQIKWVLQSGRLPQIISMHTTVSE